MATALEDRQLLTSYTLSALASFDGSGGSQGGGGVLLNGNGEVFGTTGFDAGANHGTVFEVKRGSHTVTTLASFNGDNGTAPSTRLVYRNATMFGTTAAGGAGNRGTVFEMFRFGHTIKTIGSFDTSTGLVPTSGLVRDGHRRLFGTTELGGASNHGIVFEMSERGGPMTTVASFDGTNGSGSAAGLAVGGGNGIYGVTPTGGASNRGTVFFIRGGSHTITTIVSFNGKNGSTPSGGLLWERGGNLFGTTKFGGTSNQGTVFEIQKGTHTLTTLASFNGANGSNPVTDLISDDAGNLFGTTPTGGANNLGTVFEIARGSHTITTLASFDTTTGSNPLGSLAIDRRGNLFGTTEHGGASNLGTVWELRHGR